jgi:hypothetical protein
MIFAKRALGKDFADDYVDWAGELLTQGYDSRHLRILASLGRSASYFEADDYFLRCLKELQITEPAPESAVPLYACDLAQQIIGGQITSKDGVQALYLLCQTTDYAPDFVIWYELDEALDSLLHGDFPYTYQSATLESFDTIVKLEAERFIARMKMVIAE